MKPKKYLIEICCLIVVAVLMYRIGVGAGKVAPHDPAPVPKDKEICILPLPAEHPLPITGRKPRESENEDKHTGTH